MPIGKCSKDGRGREVSKCGEVSEWLKEHAWKVCKRVKPFRGFESRSLRQFCNSITSERIPLVQVYGGSVGPPATIARKLRQVRKEATVASDSGAGMWLAELPPSLLRSAQSNPSRAALLSGASTGSAILGRSHGGADDARWHHARASPSPPARQRHKTPPSRRRHPSLRLHPTRASPER